MLPLPLLVWLSSTGTLAAPVGDVVPAPNLVGSPTTDVPVVPASAMPMTVFLDFEGHVSESRIKKAMQMLEKKAVRMEVLGSYPRSEPSA